MEADWALPAAAGPARRYSVTTNDSPQCKHCGSALPSEATHCPHCGSARVTVAESGSGIATVLTVIAGVVTAIPVWLFLGGFGAALLNGIGPPNVSGSEFGVSWGAAIFFIFITVLALTGLILQARARMSAPLRGFVIAFLCVTLGLFSICDIFALSSKG